MENVIQKRLSDYLVSKNLNYKDFEKLCGLSNGAASKLSEKSRETTLNRIVEKSDLNIEWLLTGEGEMLNSSDKPNEQFAVSKTETATTVPLIPISAQGGSLNEFVVSIKGSECERIISPINGVDFAIQVSGDSMAPEYPNGSRVFIKKINERAFIEWGKTYVLDTCNGTVIKTLVPSEKPECVKCISINPDPMYAPFEICLEDVYGMYKVLLCMSVK